MSSPRSRSVDGSELPNVRELANRVLVDNDLPDQQYTLSLMQWGQFVDHDLAHSPSAEEQVLYEHTKLFFFFLTTIR